MVFNERLHAFARYWGVRPVACAPYRARTKGKDERMVRYIKENFFVRYREFESLTHLNQLAEQWLREEADHWLPQVKGVPIIATSGMQGEGLDRLMQAVVDAHARAVPPNKIVVLDAIEEIRIGFDQRRCGIGRRTNCRLGEADRGRAHDEQEGEEAAVDYRMDMQWLQLCRRSRISSTNRAKR